MTPSQLSKTLLPVLLLTASLGKPASIDAFGNLVLNDAPVFVQGIYHDSMDAVPARYHQDLFGDLQRIADAGFNTVWVSLDPTWGLEVLDHYAYLYSRGVNVISNVHAGNPSVVLPSFAGLPALSGLAVGDDFNAPADNPHYRPDEIAARRQLIRQHVPGVLAIGSGGAHPVLPVAGYAAAMDVMGLQCYPISNTAQNVPGGVPYELETCDDMFTFVRKEVGYDYPILPTLQAFKWNHAGARYPTAAELRNMLYTVLQFAPAGVLWYSYYDGHQLLGVDKPDLWQELSLLTAEIKQLQEPFLSGTYVRVGNPNDPYMHGTEGAWHAAHWDHAAHTYLIVTNTDRDTPKFVDFPLPGKAAMRPMFTKPRYADGLRYENGRVRGTAPPDSVHVYVLDILPEPRPKPPDNFSVLE